MPSSDRAINPMATAWLAALDALPESTVVHCDTRDRPDEGLHGGLGYGIPGVRHVSYRDFDAAEDVLAGPAHVVFLWWGYRALSWRTACRKRWTSARIVLCLDTVPDARWLAGEVREWLALLVQRVDALVFASHGMRNDVLRICPWLRHTSFAVIPVAFPRRAIASEERVLPPELRLEPIDRLRVCFTGRTDYLFSRNRRVRKDALGSTLMEFADAGAEVWLSGLQVKSVPAGTPWRFMPRFSNTELFNGRMADYWAQFDATLLAYNVHGRTIRRRIRNGLSTRFALAITHPGVWIIDKASWRGPLQELWHDKPWGVTMRDRDAAGTLADAGRLAPAARSAWAEARNRLAMEHYHETLHCLLGGAHAE